MWQITSFMFLISLFIFAGIMVCEPRTLWSGISFLGMLICFAVALFFMVEHYADWVAKSDVVIGILIFLFILAAVSLLAFPVVLMIVFFVEGIKVIRHEGAKLSNSLSMLFSILLYGYVAIWPVIGDLNKGTFSTILYRVISFAAIYVLALMVAYTLSAILNLVHPRNVGNADYVVVLGCGIIGRRVTPLLAARIDKGIELLHCNPNAKLILSGGQGPGEDIPESEAMAAYAVDQGVDASRIMTEQKSVSTEENLLFSRDLMTIERPRIIIVTTAYHVFRALLLAKQQGMKCVGFGAKTKWYFTLNALIREFVGYLYLTWKKHALIIGIAAALVIAANILP